MWIYVFLKTFQKLNATVVSRTYRKENKHAIDLSGAFKKDLFGSGALVGSHQLL
jgi:hypothetical protein